jgi:DNA-binding MarR family transcriptional regulator
MLISRINMLINERDHPLDLSELMRQCELAAHRCLDPRLTECGLSRVQWLALRAIRMYPRLPQRRLARVTLQSDQAFAALAARLLAQGLITRRASATRRDAFHVLTAQGRILLELGELAADEGLEELFAPLTGPERESLRAMLRRIIQAEWLRRLKALPPPPW